MTERDDGHATLAWLGRQPWYNHVVGMWGPSYLGIVQWKVALLSNPHLKAISPVVSGCDEYRDRFYSPGGAMKLGHRLLWLRENLRARLHLELGDPEEGRAVRRPGERPRRHVRDLEVSLRQWLLCGARRCVTWTS